MPNMLSKLPNELQVRIFSLLPLLDIHTMRLTCGSIKDLIDNHSKEIYARSILSVDVIFEVEGASRGIKLAMGDRWAVTVDDETGNCLQIQCDKMLLIHYGFVTQVETSPIYKEYTREIEEKFVGRPFEDYSQYRRARCGGFDLNLGGELNADVLSALGNLLRSTESLTIYSAIETSKEAAFTYLFRAKRRLSITYHIIKGRPELFDDNFCRRES